MLCFSVVDFRGVELKSSGRLRCYGELRSIVFDDPTRTEYYGIDLRGVEFYCIGRKWMKGTGGCDV